MRLFAFVHLRARISQIRIVLFVAAAHVLTVDYLFVEFAVKIRQMCRRMKIFASAKGFRSHFRVVLETCLQVNI